MLTDLAQWRRIRHQILNEGVSIRQVSKDTSISRSTIRKILENEVPVPYKSRRTYHRKLNPHLSKLTELTEQNNSLPPYARLSVRNIFDIIKSDNQYEGSYGAVKDYVRSLKNKETSIWEHIYEIVKNWSREDAIKFLYLLSRADPPILSKRKAKKYLEEAALLLKNATKSDKREHKERAEYEWMRALLQKDLRASDVDLGVLGIPEVPQLLQKLYRGRLIDRNRSMVILANHKRITARTVCKFLGIDRATRKTYIDTYEAGGASRLFQRQPKANRKSEDTILKESVFSLLHEPPCNYGINRTTWIMRDLCGVLKEKGTPACPEVLRTIMKNAGYKWRKARIVLTSPDPKYSEKLERVQNILSDLKSEEAFFSIDEFGPFAIKMKQGLQRTPPGEIRIVPQIQKSRGFLILTAALELSENQVTHFFSKKKNTAEMLRMLETLLESYSSRKKLYLSWDAASWHVSKKLYERVDGINTMAAANKTPMVELVPLPSSAQFLNVIESVFSGMAKAIIHSSDYKSEEETKIAITRYFSERNEHFKQHPKRAGKKIWGKEIVPSHFSESHNCKDPRYR